MRLLPEITAENEAFWTGRGRRGQLMIARCDACARSIHPPELICPYCLGRSVTPRAALGTGTIYARTINRQAWSPDMAVPFALATVDLDGEPGVRVTAQVAGSDPDTVRIGQRVTIDFEPENDGVWLPVFRLTDAVDGR